MNRIILIVSIVLMAEAPLLPHAGKWSDFVTVSTEGDVVVSYRQRMKKNGWMVEWRVENMSADWVQPFTKFRTYLCVDGTRHSLKEKTLGPYPPGDQGNGGIRDREICSGSEISTVEVEIELRAVSEIIRKMWE